MAKKIIVMDGEKKLYEGPENRNGMPHEHNTFLAFGISIVDWMKMGVYIIGVIVFLVKADQRIVTLEDSQKTLISVSQSFQLFMQNSDNFHSSLMRTRFKQGQPINDNFEFKSNNGGTAR